jgi:hypothetical protein
VVLATASAVAFKRFKGNIREMHQPIAAGRLVDFKEDSYYDSITKKFYNGIYVTVYISKGAESTWEKVLDGTLSGFSIGGNIKESETEFVKDAGENGKSIRFIKDYTLDELSLVDNPCNQFSNIFSISKNVQTGELMMKGIATQTELVTVFWCEEDEIAKNSSSESESCLSCGNAMSQIGWFEKGADDAVQTADVVTKFLRQKEGDIVTKANDATGEGGVEMADEKNDSEEVAPGVVTSDSVDDAAENNEKLEEARKGSEQVVDEDPETGTVEEGVNETPTEPDFEKMFDALKGSVNETLEKNKVTVEEAVATVKTHVEEVTKAFDDKASEFEKSLGELSERLDSLKSEREEVSKRLDGLEKATAIRKSGDVETQPQEKKVQKGLWSGAFFDNEA